MSPKFVFQVTKRFLDKDVKDMKDPKVMKLLIFIDGLEEKRGRFFQQKVMQLWGVALAESISHSLEVIEKRRGK